MGVKYLWSILTPVCERKSLWEIQDKSLAIDLSGWVCDSKNINESRTHPQMYLRNLFFRTNCLLILGAHPIFVLEGKAPDMKYDVINKRRNILSQQTTSSESSKKGSRSHLNSLLKKCQRLLKIMGLSCAQSPGEAEAFCAFLNQLGVVDGCVSQDGDCFLYGANTVYRNFTISSSGGSNAGFCVDVYRMSCIEERLSLGRNKLIAISLLCGCDYNEVGVKGIGKERVLAFLNGVTDDSVLDRMKRWRNDSHLDNLEEQRSLIAKGKLCDNCGHKGSKKIHLKTGCVECGVVTGCEQNKIDSLNEAVSAELNIRSKAIMDLDFPSQEIIDEFYNNTIKPESVAVNQSWEKPDLHEFITFASTYLGWADDYSIAKFLPLITRWQLVQLDKPNVDPCGFDFKPDHIIKKRILKGVRSYEVKWYDKHDVVERVQPDLSVITVEPETLFDKVYPSVVESFHATLSGKMKPAKKKQHSLKPRKVLRDRGNIPCENKTTIESYFKKYATKDVKGSENNHSLEPFKNIGEMDVVKNDHCSTTHLAVDGLGDVKEKASIVAESKSNVLHVTSPNKTSIPIWEEWSDEEDDIDEGDLSAIVKTIVSSKVSSREEFTPPSLAIENREANELEADESFDEFDSLITQQCIPLIERLRLQNL